MNVSRKSSDFGWRPCLKHQWEALTWEPTNDHVGVLALLGGWGSGKTHGQARCAVRWSLENSWHKEYGSDQPVGIMLAPTFPILRDTMLRELKKCLPQEFILRERRSPPIELHLTNGFVWKCYSGDGDMEGITAAVVWIGEIGHPVWSNAPEKYFNALARLRDPNAKRLMMLVDGLPTAGFVREHFDRPDSESHKTILAATRDNHYIPKATLNTFLSTVSDEEGRAAVEGKWMSPPGVIYVEYDASQHLRPNISDPQSPTHVAFDIGESGAILMAQEGETSLHNVVGQETGRDKCLNVVDQILASHNSVDEMCYRIKTETDWRIVPNKSVICVDPTTRAEELNAIRKHFPGVRIVKRKRGDSKEPVEAGIRLVKRALKDALGNTRLFFDSKLGKPPYKNGMGVVDGLERYRRNVQGQPVKDNYRDHVLDCLRYLVCELLPVERPGIRVC